MTDHGFFERRPMATRGEKITMWISLVMTVAILFSAYADSRPAPGWLHGFHLGVLPIAIAELVLAATYLARARAADPGERFSPRSNYRLAALFFVLGALTIGVVALKHFKGA
jgi:hypothetical protein